MSCKWVGKGKGTCRAEGVSRLEVDLNMNANIAGFRSVSGILPLSHPLSALLTFQNVVYTHCIRTLRCKQVQGGEPGRRGVGNYVRLHCKRGCTKAVTNGRGLLMEVFFYFQCWLCNHRDFASSGELRTSR